MKPVSEILDRLNSLIRSGDYSVADMEQFVRGVQKDAQNQWQDISTVPKDESDVLVYEYGDIWIAYFSIKYSRWYPTPSKCREDDSGVAMCPTHWQPLPTPLKS